MKDRGFLVDDDLELVQTSKKLALSVRPLVSPAFILGLHTESDVLSPQSLEHCYQATALSVLGLNGSNGSNGTTCILTTVER